MASWGVTLATAEAIALTRAGWGAWALRRKGLILLHIFSMGSSFPASLLASVSSAGNAVKAAGLGGKVQVIAFDATKDAIENLRNGVVSLVIAQKPHDMGYLAVEFAMADALTGDLPARRVGPGGVTSLPRRLTTGYAVIDVKDVDDPSIFRFIYRVGK
jgi:hypothetical protein